jgi:hypothetical protein
MPSDKTPAEAAATTKDAACAVSPPPLAIGDTLTVVSGRIGGAWMVEDEFGTVYAATPAE